MPTDPGRPLPANDSSSSRIGSLCRRVLQVFTTRRNLFGLFRRYEAVELPSHNPEENSSLDELSDIPNDPMLHPDSSASFYPYPNSSSFRLGDWYWNSGAQKSQASFKELVEIIGDPEFKQADIRDAKWDNINRTLGSDNPEEWLDSDAGWRNSSVSITVPYQFRRGVVPDPLAGPQEFTMTGFYHRSLVSVIREKLAHTTDIRHFHYEPYELNWQPPGRDSRPIQVHGELYTSPAFIDAHRELQVSPAEPRCDLPRVVVALMFWSDVTHVTSFGDVKLWPLYLFFGNESKYRRCKPSCHLCNHIAYFQKVSSTSHLFASFVAHP